MTAPGCERTSDGRKKIVPRASSQKQYWTGQSSESTKIIRSGFSIIQFGWFSFGGGLKSEVFCDATVFVDGTIPAVSEEMTLKDSRETAVSNITAVLLSCTMTEGISKNLLWKFHQCWPENFHSPVVLIFLPSWNLKTSTLQIFPDLFLLVIVVFLKSVLQLGGDLLKELDLLMEVVLHLQAEVPYSGSVEVLDLRQRGAGYNVAAVVELTFHLWTVFHLGQGTWRKDVGG